MRGRTYRMEVDAQGAVDAIKGFVRSRGGQITELDAYDRGFSPGASPLMAISTALSISKTLLNPVSVNALTNCADGSAYHYADWG